MQNTSNETIPTFHNLEQTNSDTKCSEIHKERAVIRIQSLIRGWLARNKFAKKILSDFDQIIPELPENYIFEVNSNDLKPAIEIYHQNLRLLIVWRKERDAGRFTKLCRYLVASLESESPKFSYVGVALNKDYVITWIAHMNSILKKCLIYLDDLKLEITTDIKLMVLYLHVLVSFTSTNRWMLLRNKNMEMLKSGMIRLCANLMGHLSSNGLYSVLRNMLIKGLGRVRIAIRAATITAILTLALRPLISADFSEKFMTMFLINIMSVPGLIRHLKRISAEALSLIKVHELFRRSLELLSSQQSMRLIFNALEGSYSLCLLANIIEMAYIEKNDMLKELSFPTFTVVVTGLLESCQNYVASKQSTLTHWHPVLGWFAQQMDHGLLTSIPTVKLQLQLLWNGELMGIILGQFLTEFVQSMGIAEYHYQIQDNQASTSHNTFFRNNNFIKRIIENRNNRSSSGHTKISYKALGSPEVHRVVLICSMYHTALSTLTQLELDILTGLCYQNTILYDLWLFLCSLGPVCGLKSFLDHLAFNTKCSAPEFQMLQLFADCMTHYVTLLDEMEMYEKQQPFHLTDYILLSNFLNIFLYKAILGNLFDLKTIQMNKLFQSLHTLLIVLYKRDCWHRYTNQGHWLIKDIKISTFLSDLEKGKRAAQLLIQTMPHIIPHEDRVRLFRKYIANEKAALGLTESACASPQSTLITIHRNRLIEDGYRQLAILPIQALKGVIRVRFINEYGLDEAGIDQDGVFKEFLEESIKKVFDPTLNLFRATSEERLFPSPTSNLQDKHLQLFEFIGRMLGKAIYEGIIVDVPFASFFLSQVSGQTSQSMYSCIDELPSLDPALYRNLNYVKHYGDVAELNLTFSVDDDHMGKVITHELIPGGKAIPVTNDNIINYIHLVANFRMHMQVKDQTAAFIKGFRSIINTEWLSLFSTPELQRLISGDNIPLDLKDLRKNCQYYGGFHDSHRVIGWLWDILDKDFNDDEKGMFLKFVTSCSKPPLLGFAHLEPPFSIRCVEVGDDEDTGDTIGSVFRGFFTIRKKDPQNRLPTSSTCFNLLKLPNYQKKSTLREKLKYAVTCNTGFELS